ncbi:MAG: HEPN domain-containing protein [Bacteroidota bacterium]
MKKQILILEKTPVQIFSWKLTQIKYSQLILMDLERQSDIKKLGLKKKYLLNSYVINLVATWQVFIEDLLEYGVDKISKTITEEKIIDILRANSKEMIKRFNTPNTKNIDQIFKTVLGINKITTSINIEGMDLTEAKFKVNRILEIRHKIAHTGTSGEDLQLEMNFDFMEHLLEVGKQIEEKVQIELRLKN